MILFDQGCMVVLASYWQWSPRNAVLQGDAFEIVRHAVEGEKCRKVLKLSSLDTWSHGQYWIKDFSTPEPSTLLSRKALISSAIDKKWKFNKLKQKELFWGEGAGIPPSPSPSQPIAASAAVNERRVKTASLRVTSAYFRCSTFRHGHEMTASQTH